MWYWIIKVSILSFILIFLLHYLYSFFVSTLTVPKVKDLVTLPQEKYDKMFHSLHDTHYSTTTDSNVIINGNNGNNGNNTQSMKEDLINFLKDIGSKPQPSINTSGAFGSSLDTNISSFSFSK